jgi:cell pole-organizing protein PopZ
MSDAKSPSDLSMDEILAAIRRIIADDEQSSAGAGRAGGEAASTTAGSAGVAAAAPAAGPTSAPAARPSRAAEDDVLELTDALNDDGTVRRLAPIGGSSPYLAGASREPVAAAGETEPEPQAKPEPPQPETTAQPAPEPPRPEPTAPAQPAPAAASEDHLVSEVTSLAAAAAFARLASAPRTHRETPLVGDRPLDEIVQDLLRPLLQTWLDENLPHIVERLVRAEIDRIGRSGTG